MENSITLVGRIIKSEARPTTFNERIMHILCDIETIKGDIYSNVLIMRPETFYEKLNSGGYFVFRGSLTQFQRTIGGNDLAEAKLSNRMHVKEVYGISYDDAKVRATSSNRFELVGKLNKDPEVIDNSGDLTANITLKVIARNSSHNRIDVEGRDYDIFSIKLENPKHIAAVENLQKWATVYISGTVIPDLTDSDDMSIEIDSLGLI